MTYHIINTLLFLIATHSNNWLIKMKIKLCNKYLYERIIITYIPDKLHINLTREILEKLVEQKSLNLSCNTNIDDYDIYCMRNRLEKLTLHRNKNITNEGIKYLHNLKILDISNNKLICDNAIKHLSNLNVLNINNNENITNLGICNLYNLKILVIKNNTRITEFGLKYLSKLEVLDLNGDNYIDYQNVKKYLPNLKILYLSKKYKRINIKNVMNLEKIIIGDVVIKRYKEDKLNKFNEKLFTL